MGNQSWNQMSKIKESWVVSKQWVSGMVFRLSDSYRSWWDMWGPAVLRFCMSVTSSVLSSLRCSFRGSLLFGLWTLNCPPDFLRKTSLYGSSSTAVSFVLSATLVECSFSLASLSSFGVFSSCVERLEPGCQSLPLLPSCGPLSPSRLLSHWLAPLLAFMIHRCAFCPCLLCPFALSWLPKWWWSRTGGTFPGWSHLIPAPSVAGLNPWFHCCLLPWAHWDMASHSY